MSLGPALLALAAIASPAGCNAVWGITQLSIDPSSVLPGGDGGDAGEASTGPDGNPDGSLDAVSPDAAPFAPIRVAAGTTTDYVDSFGNVWSQDQAFSGGTVFAADPPLPIRLSDDPALYNSQRYGAGGSSFDYSFSVPDGSYVVTLYFAENDLSKPGQRVFNVAIDGNPVLTDFDIVQTTGGMYIPVVESFPVTVTTGQIAIHFSPGSAQNPMINAIEIENPTKPLPPPKGYVAPSFFGMGFAAPGVDTWPAFYVASFRAWDWTCAAGGCQSATWAAIETSRGVYDWSTVDAQLAAVTAAAPAADVVWTFGAVPGWANGNQSRRAPPQNLQDLYDFAQAVVSRYKGRVQDYECWDQLDTGWDGTVAQMATICKNVFGIVHATDPSARVLTPSVSSLSGSSVLQSYLDAGGGAYADVFNTHGYPVYQMPTYPEQVAYFASQMSALGAYYMPNAPFYVAEGGYGTTASVAGDLEPPFVAIYHALLASGGVGLSEWSVYDSPAGSTATGPLWDAEATPIGLNPSGVAYRELSKWLVGATFTKPIARQAGTNGVRNAVAAGAVAGTPGTLPTNWFLNAPDTANGISSEVVGTGVEGGIPYLDWRVYGTATTGASLYTQITMEEPGQMPTTLGEQWTECVDVRMIAGSLDAQGISLQGNGFGMGSYTETFLYASIEPFAKVPLGQQVHCASAAVGNAATTSVTPLVSVSYAVGGAFDVTLRVGAPLMDSGSIWLGTISRPLPPGYQADIAWDAAGGPTPFPTSRAFVRTNQAALSAVQGGTVTLTNAPILLESVQGP